MRCSAGIVALSGLVPLISAGSPAPRTNGTMEYGFENIRPSKDLIWTPCFDNFTCALLEVPLDYTNVSAGTTTLAFTKFWSNNSDAEDVLLNPGGPGGSGVAMVLSSHERLQQRLGPQFNLVGFDPRGVNNSGIATTCFPNDLAARDNFDVEFFATVDNSTHYGVADGYQRTGAFGDWCTSVHSLNGTTSYVGTKAVAQDMLHYIELLAENKGHSKNQAKLHFYGFSYGTILGATFATLYPDRLERVILDGVVDTENYYLGGLESAMYDTDEAARSFFTYCFAAGDRCSFRQNASSANELEQRYFSIKHALRKSPITVANVENQFYPVLVTWQDLHKQFVLQLYSPLDQFPVLDQMLTTLEAGNATLLASISQKGAGIAPRPAYTPEETERVINCIDQAGRYNLSSVNEFEKHLDLLVNRSSYGGSTFITNFGAPCRSYKILPPESQIFSGIPGTNKTSSPILFIGNTRDPVTPLRSAQKLRRLFAGSGLVTLNATGHASIAQISECNSRFIRAYMANATLPPPGTVCDIDVVPFFET